jgi:hypothetical protein
MAEIFGGDAKYRDQLFKVVFYALIVLIVFLFIRQIYLRVRTGENAQQRELREQFLNIHGEEFDENARAAIEAGERINHPRAIDHYRIGTVYLVNANDPIRAHRHFTNALQQIIGGMVDPVEAPFIIDRIDDFKDYFVDFPEVEDLPLAQAMAANFEHLNSQIRKVAHSPAAPAADDPEFDQKMILSRQHWQGDSQNVHDSAMYQQLSTQYDIVRRENLVIPGIEVHTYDEAKNWLLQKYAGEPENLEKVRKYLDMADNNYEVSSVPGCHEKDILLNVWRRTFDPRNRDNAGTMREAIADAVLDTVEGRSVVCMSGRSKKVWQALARVDCDPEIGVLRSKQAIRNEIYQRCAKVVDDFVGENGSASDILRQAYMQNEDSEQVRELKLAIKNKIAEVVQQYADDFDKNTLSSIIVECQSVIDV